jgi:DAK2 domain fusion protein YloV
VTGPPPNADPADGLTPERLMKVMQTFSEGLERHRAIVNRLNVYPVPDGDTGTNMALTVESVVKALDSLDLQAADGDAMGAACRAIASGSLMGARGNSGVILCQILRGISGTFAPCPVVGAHEAAVALSEGSAAARAGVMRPVEGTMLTVAADAAAAARELDEGEGGTLLEVFEAAWQAAVSSLWRTPELLPVLAQAGVVDAGGAGLVLMYDAFLQVIDGRPPVAELPLPPLVAEQMAGGFPAERGPEMTRDLAASGEPSGNGARDQDSSRPRPTAPDGGLGAMDGLRYEVMYFLQAPDDTLGAFKAVWAGIGDSIVVVGGEGLWNCHIHTDDIGAAIEAALDVGRPSDIRVTDLRDQVEEESWVRRASELAGAPLSVEEPPPVTSVVAVATGDGIRRIFYSLGVHHIVAGGQSMNPSTEQILEVVDSVPGSQVVVLPNNKNIVPVAEQVRELSGKPVFVVPTPGIQEGFAALLEYDPGATGEENAATMAAAAARVRAGEVTQAVRASDSGAGRIEAGDWIGLSRAGIESVATTLPEATCGLLGKMLGDSDEIVTLIEGAGATTADTRRISEWLREAWPGISLELHHGGQPLYPYLVSVE